MELGRQIFMAIKLLTTPLKSARPGFSMISAEARDLSRTIQVQVSIPAGASRIGSQELLTLVFVTMRRVSSEAWGDHGFLFIPSW